MGPGRNTQIIFLFDATYRKQSGWTFCFTLYTLFNSRLYGTSSKAENLIFLQFKEKNDSVCISQDHAKYRVLTDTPTSLSPTVTNALSSLALHLPGYKPSLPPEPIPMKPWCSLARARATNSGVLSSSRPPSTGRPTELGSKRPLCGTQRTPCGLARSTSYCLT